MESTASSAAPNGLDQWIELLKDKQLPVPAHTMALLKRQLQDPNVSLQRLSPLVSRDPVLAMHCVSLANQLNRNPETDVSTVELAVSTLGLERLIELINSLPAIKLNSASVPHKQYFHALADSFHAACQSVSLCRYSDRSIINATRTAALFYGIGHWALWRYAPQQMSQIKIHIYEDDQDTALAEYEVLGCTIQQISEQLAEHWQLSRLAVEALKHETSPDAAMLLQVHLQAEHSDELQEAQKRSVKQLLNAHFYPVKLANWYSQSSALNWRWPKTQRVEELISDYLQRELDEVGPLLHRNTVEASRQHPMPGLLNPAALLLLQPSELVLNYRLDTQDIGGQKPTKLGAALSPAKLAKARRVNRPEPKKVPSQPTLKTTAAVDYRDQKVFQQVLQQLSQPEQPFSDDKAILKLLQHGLIAGLGLERVLVFHINYQLRLTPKSQQGCSNDDPLAEFTLNLNIPSLFKKLTHKPLAVWAHDGNHQRIWAELPERFQAICHPQSFAMVSIFIGGEPQLILYADCKELCSTISATQFKHLKQLTVAANRALNQL